MGRPPIGSRAMTPAERMAAYRLRKKTGQAAPSTIAKQAGGGQPPNSQKKTSNTHPLSSPAQSIPSPVAPQPGPPALPTHIQQALSIMGNYRCKYDEAKAILMDANAWDDASRIPRYHRPDILSPKQQQIIDAAQNPNVRIVFIEGPRRTGKSTVCGVIIYEMGLNGKRKWGSWGATEDSSCKILRDITHDPHFPDFTRHVAYATAQRVAFDNGVIIESHASKISDAKGLQYEGIWITEFDQLLLNQPMVFGAILAILRSEPGMKLILDANSDTGAYKMFRTEFNSMPADLQDMVRFFTLLKSDVTHISDETDALITPLMEVAMGKDKTAEQMSNEESFMGEIFNHGAVMESVETYDQWMLANGYYEETEDGGFVRTAKRPLEEAILIDPGYGHATGIVVLGLTSNGHIFEEESYEFVGKPLEDDEQTAKERMKAFHNNASTMPVELMYLLDFVAGKARKYKAAIVGEGNSGMQWFLSHWRNMPGVGRVVVQTFGGDGKTNDRANYCREANQIFCERRLHIKSKELRSQLITYDPTKRESVSTKSKEGYKNKGDRADALIHGVHYFLRRSVAARHGSKQRIWDGR